MRLSTPERSDSIRSPACLVTALLPVGVATSRCWTDEKSLQSASGSWSAPSGPAPRVPPTANARPLVATHRRAVAARAVLGAASRSSPLPSSTKHVTVRAAAWPQLFVGGTENVARSRMRTDLATSTPTASPASAAPAPPSSRSGPADRCLNSVRDVRIFAAPKSERAATGSDVCPMVASETPAASARIARSSASAIRRVVAAWTSRRLECLAPRVAGGKHGATSPPGRMGRAGPSSRTRCHASPATSARLATARRDRSSISALRQPFATERPGSSDDLPPRDRAPGRGTTS